jgi:hypothetical protein
MTESSNRDCPLSPIKAITLRTFEKIKAVVARVKSQRNFIAAQTSPISARSGL